MCGIAGFVAELPGSVGRERLEALAKSLAHRGPDAAGFFQSTCDNESRQVGLVHRRLAIVDLLTGDQPMCSDSGRIALVFNGEIYNYRSLRADLRALGAVFRTESDSEVLLRAYERFGVECLSRLRGMFAFALWDSDREQLFLARDRYGEKPLFLARANDGLVFASEMKAFLKWPDFTPAFNDEVFPLFLQYRYAPGPETLLKGVQKLMPGCFGIWSKGRYVEHRYYRPPDGRAQAASDDRPEAARLFGEKLQETVDLMMQSDVPFGAFLSGGIDSSSIVAAMARRSARPIKTFAVDFDEPGYSELDYARTVARRFGTDHHELSIRARDVADFLPDASFARDNPITEPADIPIYLLAREAGKTVKMVLTGEGGDESLAGYPKHRFERHVAAVQRLLPSSVRRRVFGAVVTMLPYKARRLRIAAQAIGEPDHLIRMPLWFGALTPAAIETLTGSRPQLNGARYQFESEAGASALRRILYFDQTSWLPDNLLERGDRMTMAASIEARMPFMDHELIELASSLPDSVRAGASGKQILRDAMRVDLPKSVIDRPKVGFAMPVDTWLRAGLKDLVMELLARDAFVAGLLDRRGLERFIDEHMRRRRNHEKTLWMLLNLELWARRFAVHR